MHVWQSAEYMAIEGTGMVVLSSVLQTVEKTKIYACDMYDNMDMQNLAWDYLLSSCSFWR